MNRKTSAAKRKGFSGKRLSSAVLILLCLSCSVSLADTSIVSYQAWKSARIDQARTQVDRLQGRQETGAATKTSGKKSDTAVRPGTASKSLSLRDQRLQQAQLNLDIASELTVNDYFLLYLRQFKQREAFVEAAKKMSSEEVAELLMAYQKSVSGAHDIEVPVPAAAQLGKDATATK